MTDHLLEIDDLSPDRLHTVLDRADALERETTGDELPRKTLTMLFEKPSTRTRTSFETGMTQLGGHAVFLGPDDVGIGGREPVRDIARALGRYADGIMLRLFDHEDAETVASYAGVPVINGLTDRAHPCQTLADLRTVREAFDGFDATVAWVGDGNNVARSFAVGAAMVGLDLRICTPPGYGVGADVLDRVAGYEGSVEVVDDPAEAVSGVDAVYTDVWVSMGEEEQRAEKLEAFEDGYQVNEALLANAPDARFMHCLPAHRGEEVTDAVVEGERSLVWRQAENRLHAQKGLLVELVG
ncbi:MAG: ornithine carbamoyltransferase [Haloferacaceae archaeon]